MKDNLIKGFLLIVAVTFIALGLIKHQNYLVYDKASKFCLECIGIEFR